MQSTWVVPAATWRGATAPRRSSIGMSLIELMISITVGLLVLLGLTTIYLNASRSNTEFAKMNRQIENGRYALQILREDLWHAGFWGEYKPPQSETAEPVDPCLPFEDDEKGNPKWTLAYRNSLLSIPVQGYDSGDLTSTTCGTAPGDVNATPDHVPDTDVLVVRYSSRCIAGANCPPLASSPRFQTSLCTDDDEPYVFDIADANLDLKGKACAGPADRRNFVSHLYYVRDHASKDGDGIPTLMRWIYRKVDDDDDKALPEPLVEGIEYLELEYGVDSNGDGNVDDFKTAPLDDEWRDVVGIKVHLLARNLEATPGHEDDKTYSLGTKTLGPFNDNFKRHVYSSFVRLNNPSMRREGQGGTGGTEGSETETTGNDDTGTEPTVTDTSSIGETQ
jgi:type IV pilus assembly protein PilW